LNKIKICIIGNSVALRIRPKEENAKLYCSILHDLICNSVTKEILISNLSVSRLLTEEVIDNKNHFFNNDQDITIINLGCVDAPTREIPLWFSDIVFKRKGLLLYTIFNPVYQHIISRFRCRLVRMRGFKSWVPIERFSANIDEILSSLNGKSKVVVIGINPGNQRIENQLPRTLDRYIAYNEVLQSKCKDHRVSFISTSDLKSDKYFPDGVHYNKEGHKLIADRIFSELNFRS
jgi:lysophospholipase L1-like esterase